MARLSEVLRKAPPGLVSRVTGALFLVCATAIGVHEGRSLTAYQDSAGVWTICDGDTRAVQPGQKATPAECDARLKSALSEHAQALQGLPDDLPDAVVLGALTGAYNVGTSGFRGSSTYRCLAKKDYKCAGENWLKWKYITVAGKKYDCSIPGNKVCAGLWKRRQWEAKAISNQFPSAEAALAGMPK